jgi:hypothetical protein
MEAPGVATCPVRGIPSKRWLGDIAASACESCKTSGSREFMASTAGRFAEPDQGHR